MDDQYIEPEEELDEQPDESGEEPVDIYSRGAIFGFSIFFSTIFGGVLLFRNLYKVGLKKASYNVLAFAIAYTLFAILLVSSIPALKSSALFLNIAGGAILSYYYFPKYFPDQDYYSKPIWKALFISLLICGVMVALLYYTGQLPPLDPAKAKKL